MPDADQFTTTDRSMGFGLSQILKLLFRSMDLRIAHYDRSCDPAHPSYNEPCIWVFWHEYILSPLALWQNCDVTMLLSQHRDGNWLNNAARRMGIRSIRGSSTRGGAEAIRKLKRLSDSSGVVITPDGPRGPRRQMALGPVYLASRLGLPIVTIGFGFHNPWRLNSWDRFAIPKPGSRSRTVMGPKIRIPPKIDRNSLEEWRLEVERIANSVTESAEAWAESGKRIRGEAMFQRKPNRLWRNKSIQEFKQLTASSQAIIAAPVATGKRAA